MNKMIEVIVRKTAAKTALSGEGNLSVSLTAPSVIEIHASAADVARYVRQGKDLLIYMKDGSVIRCSSYFVAEGADGHSELVFADEQGLTHISFPDAADTVGMAPVTLTPHASPIASIAPFLEHASGDSQVWGWAAGAALGGGAIGALLAHDSGGDDKHHTKIIDKTREVESAKPSFVVSDHKGDSQGVLSANATTDDATPTFSGTGQPGATIQIKDAKGNTIASAMVGKDGAWSVKLPTQSDGTHSWSVVQIDGDKTTAAGNITLNVDTRDASVALDTTTGDNVINGAEQAAGFTLGGHSEHLANGTVLTVSLNGKTYKTTVDVHGKWSVQVPAGDAQALGDGTWTVTVQGIDGAGNRVNGNQTLHVDTRAPTLSIDALTADNVVNAAEKGGALTLIGKSSAEPGQTVTITLEGKTWTAKVGADGNWSVTLDAKSVATLAEGNHTLTASVSDKAGNQTTSGGHFSVDTEAPVVSVNTVAGDNVLNAQEQTQTQLISGSASGAAVGDTVIVTLGNSEFRTIVQADGTWRVGVPSSVLSTLGHGEAQINVSVTDSAGNTGSASRTIVLSGDAPTFTLDAMCEDNVLNAVEVKQPLTLSGSSNLPDGSSVTVTLNGVQYHATVSHGVWSTQVPVSDLQNLANTQYTIIVNGNDAVGNAGSCEGVLIVDTALPQVIINTFAGDDKVNLNELGSAQILSGRVVGAAAGDTVTITLGNMHWQAKVQKDLTWRLELRPNELTPLGDGELTFVASVTNAHGNTGTGQHDIDVNAALPGLRIHMISGDDVVNAIEQRHDLVVSGTSEHLSAAAVVTVTINGKTYTTAVDAQGHWRVGVPASDLATWQAGHIVVNASAADAWNNPVSVDRPIELDLNSVAISIDAITSDDMINAAEKGAGLVLSGMTSNVEAGQTVVVTIGGQNLTAIVGKDGSWSLTVPPSVLDNLIDGRADVHVSVANAHGNSAEAGREFVVDTVAPTLSIDNITADNIINAREIGQDLAITGRSDAEAGQRVTVTLNGKDYTGTVQADGSWSVNVPAGALNGVGDGQLHITARVSDTAGNASSAARDALVDTTVPQISINNLTADNILNAVEHGQAQIISGSATGAQAGDIVTVTLNGVDYRTAVDAAGKWSIGLPASVIKGLADGDHSIHVSLTDKAGNTGDATHQFAVNTQAPSISIDTIAGDGVINATEKGEALTITGTSNQPGGTQITVILNGIHYGATTLADGSWSVTVPPDAVGALGDAHYTVRASVTDSIGNAAAADSTVTVDSAHPIVTVNNIAGDNVLNAAELAAGQTLSGRVSGAAAGDTVTVTLGGKTYTTTVNGDLSWSLALDAKTLEALGNGDLTVSASVTNAHGNTGSGSRDFTIDASLPGLRIDTVAGDDIINSIEHGQNLIVSGSSTGLSAGSSVTVHISGKDYPATVQADGSWQAAIPAGDVSGWAAGALDITASGRSAAGNPVDIGHSVTVDTAPVAVSIDSVTADNVLNAAERGSELALSGSTANVEAGQTVTVTFNGKQYAATVQADGSWQVHVPAGDLAGLKDGSAQVQVSVSNQAGNGASASHEYHVDTTPPSITLDAAAGDNILNAAEKGADLTLSGSSTAEAGQTVTVTLNGSSYTGTVGADGRWSVTVGAADFAGLSDGNLTITATVNDRAGNGASASGSVLVDTAAPVITVDSVAGDNVINAREHGQAQIISGSATGAQAGDKVVVTLGSQSWTTTVDAAGNWSVGIPAEVIRALADGSVTLDVSVTNAAGNIGHITHDVTVDTGLPSLSFDAIATDNILNAAEKNHDLAVSGGSVNLAAGTVVTVTLNGKQYTATVGADGRWSATVPVADLAGLTQGNYALGATATNDIGNGTRADASLQVDTAAPGVTIDPITSDNVLNAAELAAGQTLSGRVSGAAAGDTVTVTLGGKTYTTTVNGDLSWSLALDAKTLEALGNGDLTVSASVTNAHGNTGSGSRDFTIDASLPGLRIDTVAGDDIINSIEHGQNLIVSGSSTGLSAGSSVTVHISGKDYPATVQADGSWQAAIPAGDVSGWAAGALDITASGRSAAGNPVDIGHSVTVDTAPVAVSIDSVTADNVLNAAERGSELALSGSTANVEAGQTVTVTFNGKQYAATVQADGSWQVHVPAGDLAGLKDGSAQVQVSVSNQAGNGASASHEYHVDTTPPSITLDAAAGDNILNAAEKGADLTLSGSSTAEAGQTVTVTLNGSSYTGTVGADGRWSVTVGAADLAGLKDGNYTVTASVGDKAGNSVATDSSLVVDTAAPTLSFNVVAGDDVINAREHGQAQIISGSTTGAQAGDKVVITLGSQSWTTTVDAAGNWSLGIPADVIAALQDGTATLTATLTNAAGNSVTGQHNVEVNTASVGLNIDALSGDDVINASEAGRPLMISGTSHQLAPGSLVTVVLNGISYSAKVQADGKWSLSVPAADVANLTDGDIYHVTASAQDGAGNDTSVTRDLSVDTSAPVLSIAPISTDNILNMQETGQTLTIHGSTSAEPGQTVTVTLGGGRWNATVQADGTWSLDISAESLAQLSDGDYTVTATVSDKAGNSTSQSGALTVDTTPPTVTIDTIAGDDVINVDEQHAGQTIRGTTTAEEGQTVVVTLNNHQYSAVVGKGGVWSVNVPGNDFLGMADGSYTITATVTDKAGNAGSGDRNVSLSGEVPTVSIDTFAQDDIVSAAEHGTPLIISGTTTAPAGQNVTITLNGKSYSAVVQADGTWTYTLGSADVTALADGGAYTIHAEVKNAIGNAASDDRSITVDLTPPSMGISIDTLQHDTGLSHSDFITNNGSVTLQGSLTAQPGNDETAQISLDGGKTWIDLTVTGTHWSYSDGRSLADGTWNYQVRVIDKAGNIGAVDSRDVIVDTTPPDASVITVDAVNRDTGLDNHDFITSDNTLTLNGSLNAGLAAGEHAQISLDGGKTWVDVAVSGKSWSWVDNRTLADGDYHYQLRVIDDAGNISATTSKTVTVDTQAPDASKTVSIDSISDDTGRSDSDFVTSDTSLTLRGSLGQSLLDGEHVQISLDGGTSWTLVTVIGNQWYYTDTRTLSDGNHEYWVRVIDDAGNVGESAHRTVTVDTQAPDATKSVTIDSISDDTGFNQHDYLTNDTSITLNGSLGAPLGDDEFVQVSLDGGQTWVDVTSVNGTQWQYVDSRTLTDGSYDYQVRVVDLAGNVGATTGQTVTVDTTAPAQSITIDGITDDSGQSASDFITNDTTLTLNGTLGGPLGAGEHAQISVDGGKSWVDVAVSGNQWSYVDGRTLTDGDYTYQVRVIDDAGNVGSHTQRVVTVDTVAPDTVGTIVSYTDTKGERTGDFGDRYATDDTAPVLHGTLNHALADGEIAQLFRDGVLIGQVAITGGTQWSFADSGLPDGSYRYVLRVTDKAGNYTDSKAFDLSVDTSIPTTMATVDGITTSDTTPILTGSLSESLDHNAYLTVTVNGKTYTSEPGGAVVVDPLAHTWYLQIPDGDALTLQSYSVTAQVKSSAGNGNTTGVVTGTVDIIDDPSVAPAWSMSAENTSYSATYTLGTNGLWNIMTNQRVASAHGQNDYSVLASDLTMTGNYTSGAYADINRDGIADILAMGTSYDYMAQWNGNADGSFSYTRLTNLADVHAAVWYGSVVAIDLQGDGYTDFVLGDAGGPDSNTLMLNNGGTLSGSSKGGVYSKFVSGAKVGNYNSLIEASGVDLNNDGMVDIAQHTTNGANNYALSTMLNQGDGSFVWGQNFINTMYSGIGSAAAPNAVSMTWADYNGDGYMDLYMGMSSGSGTNGFLMLNDGTGKLNAGQKVDSDALAGRVSVAVDWDHDGDMDIIKLGNTAQSRLYTNDGSGHFTSSALGSANASPVAGAALMDYDWDGAEDLLIIRKNGDVTLERNTHAVAEGTALHLKIVDGEGINAFYGNTVQLFNAAGQLVASRIINAQSGMGVNDASGLVSFYGLSPDETYSAVLVRGINGVSSNATWDDLTTGDARHNYVLTADAASGGNSGTMTGTGYNDTFIAGEGTHIYQGSGGWETTSEHRTWSSTGGMDVVDYRHATSGITADLSVDSAQNTGYDTATFKNIEGISGSNFSDVITGSSGNNLLEGRGGNDTFNIGNGGHDTLLYRLIDAGDATGGNGSDVVNGFSVGTWEGTADSDRIDLRDLLSHSGYTGNGSASYINGTAHLDAGAGNITDYIRVVQNGSNTEIQVDRDGTGGQFDPTTVITLNGVQTDLATLLANHQLQIV